MLKNVFSVLQTKLPSHSEHQGEASRSIRESFHKLCWTPGPPQRTESHCRLWLGHQRARAIREKNPHVKVRDQNQQAGKRGEGLDWSSVHTGSRVCGAGLGIRTRADHVHPINGQEHPRGADRCPRKTCPSGACEWGLPGEGSRPGCSICIGVHPD